MQVLNFPSPYRAGETPYDIFKDRMSAIGSIVGGIKEIIGNKYTNKQLNLIADNILNQVDENKANELVNLISEPPPEEIYPSGLEDTVGQFYDFVTHPKQAQTGLPQTGMPQTGLQQTGLPQLQAPQTTSEAMIPKGDIFQLFNAVKSMPSGQVNWANLFKTMTAKKPYFMGTTEAEIFVMNQMQTQIKDPKKELEGNVNLAKLIQETFYPEQEVKDKSEWEKKYDALMLTNPSTEEVKKFIGGYIEPEKPTDYDKKLEMFLQTNPTVDEAKKFVGGYIEPDKMSEFEKKFDLFLQTNPNNNEVKKFLGGYITPEGTSTTATKTTTAEANFAEKQFTDVRTNAQYNQALAKVRQIDPNVIVPLKPELFKNNYNEAVSQIQMLINDKGEILDMESKSGYSYEMLYAQSYKDLEEAINEYRIATGETLDNPFVSPEEYKKVDTAKKNYLKPSTWGQQKSVFKGENNYKDGDIEVIKGKTYKYNAGEDKWEVVSS